MTSLSKGLSKNYSVNSQPEETITFALNGIKSSHKGEMHLYQSEPGNIECLNLPEGYKPIGSIYITNNETVVWSTNGEFDEIGIHKQCKYTTLVNAVFGFDITKPILATFRIKNGCERIVYWVDGNNEDRYFNLDRPELFKDELGNWDINKFRLNPEIIIPNINIVSVNDINGNLLLGSYSFQIEILDAALNVIYKSYISPEVKIIDNSLNESFHKVDGGYNIDNYTPEIGGVQPTTKSISLEFTNVDTKYTYIRVVVIRRIGGDGIAVSSHNVGTLIPIINSTVKFTYRGFNPGAGDTVLDYSSTLIPLIAYNSSEVITQVQNRLVRGNVKIKDRDYTGYQRLVNNIVLKPYVYPGLIYDVNDKGNTKNPEHYWNYSGYQSDEIYAKGIVFVYDDGTESPVFSLIGRQSVPSDTELLVVGTDIAVEEVDHLGLVEGEQVERWKVMNTGSATYTNSGNYTNLEFAYHQSETGTYPLTKDCTGQFIFGDLAGQPVRHFRYPDRSKVDVMVPYKYSGILGFEADASTIVYPDPDIVGHYFVRAERDELNRTVLDSGYLMPARDPQALEENGVANSGVFIGNSQYTRIVNKRSYFVGTNTATSYNITLDKESRNWVFYSPRAQFEKSYLNGTYFTFIKKVGYFLENIYSFVTYEIPDSSFDISVRDQRLSQFANSDFTNRAYNSNIYVDRLSVQEPIQEFPTTLFNGSHSNDLNFYRFDRRIPLFTDYFNSNQDAYDFYYVVNKKLADVYPDVLSITYYRAHTGVLDNTSNNIVFGGDVFISDWKYVSVDAYDAGGQNANAVLLSRLPVESEINVGLRHSGVNTNTYYRGAEIDTPNVDVSNPTQLEEFVRYILTKITAYTPTDGYQPLDVVLPEFYKINNDYYSIKDTFYQPLPLTYNYCSKCRDKKPTRIIFSPQDFDEELVDNYRITLSEDYIDLPAHKGEIFGLKYKRNQLLVNCKEGSFLLQPSPQQISTDQNLAYLTTGDFLSIPAQELIQSDTGYGGLQDKLGTLNNKYHYVWIDNNNFQINTFGDGLNTINGDIDYWLGENLPFKIDKTLYELIGKEIQFKSIMAGLGVQLVYDPYFERLIIHKADYDLTDLGKELFNGYVESDDGYTTGLQVNINNGKWRYTVGGSWSYILTTNNEIFINKSWTLSYSYESQSWVSWHSYQPEYMFYDSNDYYTFVDNIGYKHLKEGNYQNYYNTKYDFIIEYLTHNPVTQDTNTVHYYGQTLSFDKSSDQWIENRDVTFDRMMLYNQYHSTGLQKLNLILQDKNPYGNLNYIGNVKNVIRTDKNYKIGMVYDISTAQPVVTSDWNVINPQFFNGQGYIDLTVNNSNIDYNRPQRELRQLKDKWVKTRLYFRPKEDLKKIIYFTITNTKPSIR